MINSCSHAVVKYMIYSANVGVHRYGKEERGARPHLRLKKTEEKEEKRSSLEENLEGSLRLSFSSIVKRGGPTSAVIIIIIIVVPSVPYRNSQGRELIIPSRDFLSALYYLHRMQRTC
jgi:hypothetical protein